LYLLKWFGHAEDFVVLEDTLRELTNSFSYYELT
jgi:hypothetical protein